MEQRPAKRRTLGRMDFSLFLVVLLLCAFGLIMVFSASYYSAQQNSGDGLYYVDTTFDDSSDKNILHFYFNLTKADIAKDHIFAEGYSANKVYDGSETFNFFSVDSKAVFSNYYERNGLYIEEDCILALAALYEADKAGKKSVELKNITDRSLKSAFNLLCKKAYGTVTLKYCLYYDENNVLIANW